MKERVFAAIAISIGIVLALGIAEIGLRLFWDHPSLHGTHVHEKHPYYHHRPIPGIEATISGSEFRHKAKHTLQGLRGDKAFSNHKPDSIQRVLFLGDSFTYGMGVEDNETFVQHVANQFPSYDVANTGVTSYDTRNELAVLEKFGAAFQPELTILCFFWNDLEGNLGNTTPDYVFDNQGNCIRMDEVEWYEDPMAISDKGNIKKVKANWRLKIAIDEGLRGLRYRLFGVRKRFIRTKSQKNEALKITAKLLDVMRCLAEQIGTELVILSIPDQSQIDANDWVKNIGPLNYEVQNFLQEYCEHHKIAFVDPRPQMISNFQTKPIRQYYYYDRHLTPEGHRVIGKVLIDFLLKRISGKSE